MTKKLILIKLGGSLITQKDKPYTSNPQVIKRLALEIKKAQSNKYQYIIAHGGGSFPHISAKKYKTKLGLINKQSLKGLSLVQQDAFKINRIVNQIFTKANLNVLSFPPSSFIYSNNQKLYSIYSDPITQALRINATPLVFGDIILDKQLGFTIFSGEKILNHLASNLSQKGYQIKKIIQCGITNGVYNSKGKTIPKITPQNFSEIKKSLQGSASTDVTGGMAHKVKESLDMAQKYSNVYIINGQKKNNLYQTITSNKNLGTLISA